jgi:hypothetical protein
MACVRVSLPQRAHAQVVALGNLLPADSSVDELDSYMYQTVRLGAGGRHIHTWRAHKPARTPRANKVAACAARALAPQVGHQLVSAYASCTGLPLYRRRIQGHSRSQVRGGGAQRLRQACHAAGRSVHRPAYMLVAAARVRTPRLAMPLPAAPHRAGAVLQRHRGRRGGGPAAAARIHQGVVRRCVVRARTQL